VTRRGFTGETAGAPQPLVLAVPKGRVLRHLGSVFEAAGLSPDLLDEGDRRLLRDDPEAGLRVLLLKPDDVPTYVEWGAADVGLVGRDVLTEREYDLYVPMDLGIGRCRMVVAGPPGRDLHRLPSGRPLRVGTKFTNVATTHFRGLGLPTETVYLQGSVELGPVVGLTDVVVDLVETGETLRKNGLVEYGTIFEVSTLVVANRVSFKLEQARVRRLVDALSRAVDGHNRRR